MPASIKEWLALFRRLKARLSAVPETSLAQCVEMSF